MANPKQECHKICATSSMANHHNTQFLLDREDVVLVTPSKPTPSGVLSLSSFDNSPALETVCQTLTVYQSKVESPFDDNHDFTSGIEREVDPACRIKEALSKALVYYYPLAGRLKRQSDGRLEIDCTADGVPFSVATANTCRLSSFHYLDGIDVEVAKQFVSDVPSEDDLGYRPLTLQVTKFSCGSFIIGMSLSHSICDGYGAALFFRALTELARWKSEPSVKPVWERERLMGRATDEPLQGLVDDNSLAISPYIPSTDIVHRFFDVRGESIKRLKTSLMKECETETPNVSFTTVEVLSAYVWRSRFRALKLNSDGKTILTLPVGIRNLLNPPLSDGYYGNAFVSAQVVLTGGELNEAPLSTVAKLIKESKEVAASQEYIKNSLDIMEKFRLKNVKLEGGGASMILTDWRQLGFLQEVGIGANEAVKIIPIASNLFGRIELCLLLPPSMADPTMRGGATMLASLPMAAMAKFEEEMDALKLDYHSSCL